MHVNFIWDILHTLRFTNIPVFWTFAKFYQLIFRAWIIYYNFNYFKGFIGFILPK